MKLTLKTEDDASAIDSLIEGSMEVLEDDDEMESPRYKDYDALWHLIHAAPITAYPHEIDMQAASDGQRTLLREMIQNCRDTHEEEFTATFE